MDKNKDAELSFDYLYTNTAESIQAATQGNGFKRKMS